MAYDQQLERRIDVIIRPWPDVEKKSMFGGICYLLRGNMCFGIWRELLIVRAGAGQAEARLQEPHVRPFNVTGKPMKGWVMVEPEGAASPQTLEQWLSLGRSFAESLPPK